MSEFSDSYHIRTEDADTVVKRLRQLRYAGITFGPSDGWLTFVPYEEHDAFRRSSTGEGFTRDLSRTLSTWVIHYTYGEDHGWSFTSVRPGEVLNRFACWWGPAPAIEREQLYPEALRPIVDTGALDPILRQFDAATARQLNPAYEFASLLRLPHYRWLSPHLAQHHTADLIAQGGKKFGSKPPAARERLRLPPRREVNLPRPDVSGREALDLITPFVQSIGTAWRLVGLSFGGRLQQNGRLDPVIGHWDFTYANSDRPNPDLVSVWLYGNGGLSFVERTLGPLAPRSVTLPNLGGDWLDSSAIAESLIGEPSPDGICQDYSLFMHLRPRHDLPTFWEVVRVSTVLHPVIEVVRHSFAVEAASGQIAFETFERQRRGATILSRLKRRSEGGVWEDMPIGSDRST